MDTDIPKKPEEVRGGPEEREGVRKPERRRRLSEFGPGERGHRDKDTTEGDSYEGVDKSKSPSCTRVVTQGPVPTSGRIPNKQE